MIEKLRQVSTYRVVFITGLIIIAFSIFIDTYKVAALSSVKASQERYKVELTKKTEDQRKIDKEENKKIKKEYSDEIRDYEISINDILLSVIFRFIGSIVFLIGSLGMLILGDNYERVGVLFAIGFGIKTILGL